jgi:hypothetical protein
MSEQERGHSEFGHQSGLIANGSVDCATFCALLRNPECRNKQRALRAKVSIDGVVIESGERQIGRN